VSRGLGDVYKRQLVASHDINDVLSFSDEVIVLKDTTVLEKATPYELYNHPKYQYTAALFGDVNEMEINGKTRLIYPNQLQIVEKSDLQVEVVSSYFKGKYYLIEAKWNNQIVFFETEFKIDTHRIIHLSIKQRLPLDK
jgi:iron(III) transport system ATP-binding protein